MNYHPSSLRKKPLSPVSRGILSTGLIRLDRALGIGGIPRGEFIEITGGISSGKTTLCQHIVSEAQRAGEICGWLDIDHSLDPTYAIRCGVEPDLLYVIEPDNAEMAFDILHSLVSSGSFTIIILDSIHNLISRDELGESLSDKNWICVDRLFSQTLSRVRKTIHENKTTIIFTELVSPGIGSVYQHLAQNLSRLATKLQSSVRIRLETFQDIKQKNNFIGNRIKVRVTKNQYSPCFQRTFFDIIYNKGIDKSGEIFDVGTELGLIQFNAESYWFQAQEIGNERAEVLSFLDQNRWITEEIEKNIRQILLLDVQPAVQENITATIE